MVVLPSGTQWGDILWPPGRTGRSRFSGVGESRHGLPQPSEVLMDRAVDDLLGCPGVSKGHREEELAPNTCRDSVAGLFCRLGPRGTSASARHLIRHASTL